MVSTRFLAAALLPAGQVLAQEFTISNGQIFTPGFVVLDAPQPGTPLGGDTLHVAIDVTANGKLPLEANSGDNPSQIFNITMFLYSYDTGRNFTISNGTASANNASLGEIMAQEPGSTVKHVNWVWPDCLVGNGQPQGSDSDRGTYNISIRQNFRLNDEDHYTIFDVPISVTNSIEDKDDRPSCDSLSNELLEYGEIDAESANEVGILFAPGDATKVDTGDLDSNGAGGNSGDAAGGSSDDDDDDDDSNNNNNNNDDNTNDNQQGDGEGLGGSRPEAGPEDGLGNGAMGLSWNSQTFALPLMCLGAVLVF